jgi:hypothetical protein
MPQEPSPPKRFYWPWEVEVDPAVSEVQLPLTLGHDPNIRHWVEGQVDAHAQRTSFPPLTVSGFLPAALFLLVIVAAVFIFPARVSRRRRHSGSPKARRFRPDPIPSVKANEPKQDLPVFRRRRKRVRSG